MGTGGEGLDFCVYLGPFGNVCLAEKLFAGAGAVDSSGVNDGVSCLNEVSARTASTLFNRQEHAHLAESVQELLRRCFIRELCLVVAFVVGDGEGSESDCRC